MPANSYYRQTTVSKAKKEQVGQKTTVWKAVLRKGVILPVKLNR